MKLIVNCNALNMHISITGSLTNNLRIFAYGKRLYFLGILSYMSIAQSLFIHGNVNLITKNKVNGKFCAFI